MVRNKSKNIVVRTNNTYLFREIRLIYFYYVLGVLENKDTNANVSILYVCIRPILYYKFHRMKHCVLKY